MNKVKLRILILIVTMLNINSVNSEYVEHPVIDIVHFNFDCVEDTLLGIKLNKDILPYAIKWGKVDSTNCLDSNYINDTNNVNITYFILPPLKNIKGGMMRKKLNMDSLSDLMVFFNGIKVDSVLINDTLAIIKTDTSRRITIFGQNELQKQSYLDLYLIDSIQSSPFYAQDIIEGRELSNKKEINENRIIFYTLEKVNLNIPIPKINVEHFEEEQEVMKYGDYEISIFPNPTKTFINLSIHNLKKGIYELKLINLESAIIFDQKVNISTNDNIFKQIDLSRLTNGKYYLLLNDGNTKLGTYPIIIKK